MQAMRALSRAGSEQRERVLHSLGSERPIGSWQQQPWTASALPSSTTNTVQYLRHHDCQLCSLGMSNYPGVFISVFFFGGGASHWSEIAILWHPLGGWGQQSPRALAEDAAAGRSEADLHHFVCQFAGVPAMPTKGSCYSRKLQAGGWLQSSRHLQPRSTSSPAAPDRSACSAVIAFIAVWVSPFRSISITNTAPSYGGGRWHQQRPPSVRYVPPSQSLGRRAGWRTVQHAHGTARGRSF